MPALEVDTRDVARQAEQAMAAREGADLISEHERLQAHLKSLHEQKPIGRPVGAKTKPMPAKEGPLWQAFVTWARDANIRADHFADAWRAFYAGADAETKANTEGR
jgi:hypothetical protein